MQNQKDKLYHYCMMCQTVEAQGIHMNIEAYRDAGGLEDNLTTGICQKPDCRTAYIMYAVDDESLLVELLKKASK